VSVPRIACVAAPRIRPLGARNDGIAICETS